MDVTEDGDEEERAWPVLLGLLGEIGACALCVIGMLAARALLSP